MAVLFVIGGILLLLFLLLCIPVKLKLTFRQEFQWEIHYLFLTFRPSGEERAEEEPEEELGEPKKEKLWHRIKRMLKRKQLSGFLESISELVALLKETGGKLMSHVKLRYFDLYLCVGSMDDAAEAAIFYGKACSVAYSACGILFELLPCKKKFVTVDLDYQAPQYQIDFSAHLSLRPLFGLIYGLGLLLKGAPAIRKLQKTIS